jgi:hypothetical protein
MMIGAAAQIRPAMANCEAEKEGRKPIGQC